MIFVATPGNDSPTGLMNRLEIAFNSWGGNKNKRLIGAIINKIGAPVDDEGRARPDLSEVFDHQAFSAAILPVCSSCRARAH